MYDRNPLFGSARTMAGYDVHKIPTSALPNKISLDPKFKWCSDEFRREMNSWLREQFGVKNTAYVMGNKLLVSGETYDRLRLYASNVTPDYTKHYKGYPY